MHPSIKILSAICAGALLMSGLGARQVEPVNMSRAVHRVDQPMRYLFKQSKTTLATMGPFIESFNEAIMAGVKAGKLSPDGPPVFVYEGADGNPDTQFTLKVGVPVREDQKPLDGFEIVELPKYESVSSVYCGSMAGMGEAYGKLFGELMELGYEPVGTSRETYLHWEGMDSENDITLLSVEVKAKGV